MHSKKPIYMDYMATTPIDPRVIDKMLAYMGPDAHFGNPASTTHIYGLNAAKAVDRARMQVADAVGARPNEIIFTSGATEADNLAILGGARFYQRKGRHLITMCTEHKAVLDTFKQLEREGFEVSYLAPQANGLLDLHVLDAALRDDTILVSIMQVNNEIGVIQDIAQIGALLRGRGVLFHVDAAQSVGKTPLNLQDLPVDLMSFSAHKSYGPKGIGALYVRHKPRVRIQSQSFGGGHERGMRAGTLPTHQIVGMGEAFALADSLQAEEHARLLPWRKKLWQGICHIPTIAINGDFEQRIAGNLNFSVQGMTGDALLVAMRDLALSTSSACTSDSLEPSYVIRALGVSAARARSSIRLSLGRYTTEQDIQQAIDVIKRGLNP